MLMLGMDIMVMDMDMGQKLKVHQQISFHSILCSIHMVCNIRIHIHNEDQPQHQGLGQKLQVHQQISFHSIPCSIRMVCNIRIHIHNEDQPQHQGLVQKLQFLHRQISFHSIPNIHRVCSNHNIHKVCIHSIHTKHQHQLQHQGLVLKLGSHQHQQISFHSILCSIRMVYNIHIRIHNEDLPQHQGLVQKLQFLHQQISFHSIPNIHRVCSIHNIHKVCIHSIHTKHQHLLQHQDLDQKLGSHPADLFP